MKKILLRLPLMLLAWATTWCAAWAETDNPAVVTELLTRVTAAADRFETVLDEDLATTTATDVFVITAKNDKPCIKGSSVLAITTGLNWYLNHYAHVNIAWNNLTTDLSTATLPVPTTEESHEASVDYRYYLNYCTFSYSMSTWTWERWQKEIDWMALHGINMPLQIVGLDVVWKKLLTEDLGYTSDEANDFIAGPCFQAWWGMNNLEGWGGPNPDWWYTRQETLCQKILARERELGMQPVLPGYSGMVPSDIGEKGYTANSQGSWCGFVRPYILDPNSTAFTEISAKYYARLEEVMGTSKYYSMDPFHEGANTGSIDVPSAYKKIAEAMLTANSEGHWVIQSWQWSSDQYYVLDNVDKGRLIILDLYSDAFTLFDNYKGHDAIYCIIPNFGGRTGFFGRLSKIMTEFFSEKSSHSNVKGVGATPEGIEQVPVLYDALYELPWRSEAPDPAEWVKDYATARYGTANADAATAWEKLRTSSLACPTELQGPMEAVVCARPALQVGSVSSWGGTDIFYDPQEVVRAAELLNESGLSGENFSYDATDLTRQALTDYAYYLLKAINTAHTAGDTASYALRRDKYLSLILDIDRLLCTNSNFMLGRWTQLARGIADEATGTTESDRQWLELNNARTLITTWGDRDQSESGGLRDYSYREWGGMMKDFYYPRWEKFFSNLDAGSSQPDWFTTDWAWAHNAELSYDDTPTGNTAEVASELFDEYFIPYKATDGTTYYIYRCFDQDYTKTIVLDAYRGESLTLSGFALPSDLTATLSIDLNSDGVFSDDETTNATTFAIPTTATTGRVKATLKLSDGTEVTFAVALRDRITSSRTVTVASADATQGSVAISGSTETSVTNTEDVTIQATPATGYDFLNWTNAAGDTVSTDNPYTYYGAAAEDFTAHFLVNKWGTPVEDTSELSTIESYGQYLETMTVTQNGGDAVEIYSASSCPSSLFHTTQIVNAAQGSMLKLAWNDPSGGLSYCRLSAYIDLNSDGDFDDDDELLAVVGDKSSAGNSQVSSGSLSILLPYDVPLSITHVRLRFDSSWADGLDSTTDAMPAKASTKRMVYDVPVNVTEYATTACTVSVATSNEKQGTVDANGQPDTYTYGAGVDIVLRAYPTDGYEVSYWTDDYGRQVPTSWQDGNFLRFKAPESGTYTAHFSSTKTLTCGSWTLGYDEDETGGVVITSVESGAGELDLSATNSTNLPVTGINTDVFSGNTTLTSITLPATLNSFDTFLDTSFKGTGEAAASLKPSATISASCPWTLHLAATSTGTSYNDWGSGLLATGTNALADSYDGGFQLYLAKAGTLTVKVGSNATAFSTTLGSPFSIDISYDGTSVLKVKATSSDGQTEEKSLSCTLNAISTFVTALPIGIDITRLVVNDPWLSSAPFSGCTALTDFAVAEGSTLFTATKGLLYDKTGNRLVAYPEGRLTTRAFRLLTSGTTPRAVYATPLASTDGTEIMADDNRGVLAAKAATTSVPASLWTLEATSGGYKVKHLNSQRFFGSAEATGSAIELPADPNNWYGTYTYSLTLKDGVPHLTLALASNGLYAAWTSGTTVKARATAYEWTLDEVSDSLNVTTNTEGWASVCLPVDVVVPTSDQVKAFVVSALNETALSLTALTAETIITAGQGFLIKAAASQSVALPIAIGQQSASISDNLLIGATASRTGFNENAVYTLGANDGAACFLISTETTVDANTAYLANSSYPDVLATVLTLEDPTGINHIATNTAASQQYYDLQGRRVKPSARGIYISSSGEKILHR